jgi:CRISPR-associated endonuclease/helicase Cas3
MPSPFTMGDEKGLDARSRTSHNGNLSRTFAVDMADSLANTGIEGSARPIAHRRQGDGATHDLEEHLRAAALLAGRFAAAWGASETAALAALWHDLGKYAAEFQAMITASDPDAHLEGVPRGPRQRINHSSASALWAMQRFRNSGFGRLLAYPIAGHHSGLPDWIG